MAHPGTLVSKENLTITTRKIYTKKCHLAGKTIPDFPFAGREGVRLKIRKIARDG